MAPIVVFLPVPAIVMVNLHVGTVAIVPASLDSPPRRFFFLGESNDLRQRALLCWSDVGSRDLSPATVRVWTLILLGVPKTLQAILLVFIVLSHDDRQE
jgi:hypothetical protein